MEKFFVWKEKVLITTRCKNRVNNRAGRKLCNFWQRPQRAIQLFYLSLHSEFRGHSLHWRHAHSDKSTLFLLWLWRSWKIFDHSLGLSDNSWNTFFCSYWCFSLTVMGTSYMIKISKYFMGCNYVREGPGDYKFDQNSKTSRMNFFPRSRCGGTLKSDCKDY